MTDADLFEAFVREYQDMVFATAVRLLGNPVDAEDVSQTVFLKAYERFDQIGASPTAAGWLKTVATNICLNHLSRYRSRWRLFSEMRRDDDDGGEAGFEATVVADTAAPGAGLDARERQEQVERAVRQLPEHQRVPLVLFHFEQHSYQAIADLLGITLAKVKTDIHRAREALRITLGTL
ncbi:MAG: sigma-70 family RNA polymerase sigma factor [Acidobacteriota bacterium]